MTTRALDLEDADARLAISNALDETFVVEAAAGTGKTTELVERIVAVLAEGRATMDEIVAVTFTEKAAGELKLRLRAALEEARATSQDSKKRERIELGLRTLENAHVNTIHGFCAELMRERPVEARVDPLFTVLTDAQSERLYAQAFRAWIEDALADPPEGVRRALRRTSGAAFGGLEDAGPIERLRGAGWTLASLGDFPHPWRRPMFTREHAIEQLLEGLHGLASASAQGPSTDALCKSLERVRRDSQQILFERSLEQRDLDGWEARLIDLVRDQGLAKTRKGSGIKFGSLTRASVLSLRDAFYEALRRFRADADGDLAALLQQELQEPARQYQELKRRKGALDFGDLLSRVRDLLRGDRVVREALQRRFARIFVDEFQDTDPVQAEILLLLSADDPVVSEWTDVRTVPGKLFIVGDPKQAIYRFRGADVNTYWNVRDQVATSGGRVLQLTTNFRSVPALQRFVNSAFEREMTDDKSALQAAYVPLAERRPEMSDQPAVVALPVPAPYSSGRFYGNDITRKAIEDSLPKAVGAFVRWLVRESGWQVSDRHPDGTEARVPVAPKHIAVLFRRFTSFDTDVTRAYIEALDAHGLPHLLVGGKAFHDREEVETMRAALAAIEWPDDELSVFATLKGSLFAIDDELLLEYRHRFKPIAFHPFRIPKELGGTSGVELALSAEPTAHFTPIADALRLLQELHRRRNHRPVADTIAALLEATRAHVSFILRQSGEQALANVLHVAELARQYEAEGGMSFRGFIEQLRQAAEATSAAEAPIVEEGSDGVRLMTVHKAKGLEFPVVVLADITCHLNRDEASRYLDADRGLCAVKLAGWAPHDLHEHEHEEVSRDQAEGVRLAYVAATRARDVLVVPVVGDGPFEDGWLRPLNSALYPTPDARQSPAAAPKCPPLKSKDSVLTRPDDRLPDARTVAPGLHAFDGYSVLWCDPRWLLPIDVPPAIGVRRQELITKEVPREIVDARRHTYDSWKADRDAARRKGSLPSMAVLTARALAASRAEDPAPLIPVVEVAGRTGASRGAAFGVLVHAVLADVPLDASSGVIADVARQHARVLGAPDDDVTAAVMRVNAALQHGLFARARRAAASGRCRRETPVVDRLEDGRLVEGIVDLAFEEDGVWTVVDYKTDRDLTPEAEAAYRHQVASYVLAISHATGAPATGIVLRV